MKKIFSILLASMTLASCVDTVILPDNKILDEDYWKRKSEVTSVLSTAYVQLRDANFMRSVVVWGDFRSDELILDQSLPVSATYRDALNDINSMSIQTDNTFTSWYPLYSCINYCNLVLENAEGVVAEDPDYTTGDYLADRASALALRSLCYFYLVRVFRDVPVTPGAYMNSSDDLNAPQMAPAEVLQMCIDNLTEAAQNAPANNAYFDWRDRGFMNRDAIYALLADIYLWRASVNHSDEDYRKCVEYCDIVIANKKNAHVRTSPTETEEDYYLADYTDYYNEVFCGIGNSEESIFELQFQFNRISNTGLWQMYHNYSSNNSGFGYLKTTQTYAKFNASSSSSNIFKNDKDQRLFDNCYDVSADKEQYDVRKFCALGTETPLTSESRTNVTSSDFTPNWIFYRLTDIMLMKAEALVQLQQPEAAFELVKVVNDRALSDPAMALSYNTYSDMMEELVLMERARELCFEGKRWFDLMRYNYRRMNGVDYTKKLSELSDYPVNSDEFFNLALSKYATPAAMKAKMPTEPYLYMPINEDEVKMNTNLQQNPVYLSTSKY